MYKFLLNFWNQPLKKTKISEEKLKGQCKYEKKNRKCTFLPRWEKEFTCLKNMEKGMVCVICSKHEHIRSFITGVLMSLSGNWIVV
jgi:hypothetical protein